MHILQRAYEEDGRLREIVGGLSNRIAENPLKQGIILDFNPYWLEALRLNQAGLSENLLYDLDYLRRRDIYGSDYVFIDQLLIGGPNVSAPDLSVRSKVAKQFIERLLGRDVDDSPFLLRIFAYPMHSVPKRITTERSIGDEARQQLVNAARETPIATIVQTQAPARLLMASGDRVFQAGAKFGTLGGFLEDPQRRTVFGVTCGHVIGENQRASTRAGPLGTVKYSIQPERLPAGIICGPKCGRVSNLDVSLIELNTRLVPEVAKNIAEQVVNGDLIDMRGASSGRRRYEAGPFAVEIAIEDTCWEKLFIFHAPKNQGMVDPGIRMMITPPPEHGDSGAWLIRNGDEWAGMVVATSPYYGYALASTAIIAHSKERFGLDLVLPSNTEPAFAEVEPTREPVGFTGLLNRALQTIGLRG